MNTTWMWLVIVAVLIGGGVWFLFTGETSESMEVNIEEAAGGSEEKLAEVSVSDTGAVSYDGASFSPSSVIVKKGGVVTWTGPVSMWVASAAHPTHVVYDGTARSEHCPNTGNVAFDQCARGASYNFTFTKIGTWNYHDHANASASGEVTVVE